MKAHAIAAIQETFEASNAGAINFGQVVARLVQAGVESYHVDYRAGLSTYHLRSGEAHSIAFDAAGVEVMPEFSAEGMVAAIRGAQSGVVKYPEFKKLSQAAGCGCYTVWISGRHVSYFGRKGEVHVEPFPN